MLDPREYVIGTLEPCDVKDRLESVLIDFIAEHDLMDAVVFSAVDRMRGWYDECAGDAMQDAISDAAREVIGSDKVAVLLKE